MNRRNLFQLSARAALMPARSAAVLLLAGGGPLAMAQNCPVSIASAVAGPTLGSVRSLGAGDFNGDGRDDLVVLNNSNPTTIDVRFSLGGGSFAAPVSTELSFTSTPNRMTVVDLTGDGVPDIFVETLPNTGVATVMRGSSNGTFAPLLDPQLHYISSAVGDLNGDGRPDLVGFLRPNGAPLSGELVAFVNQGNGQFSQQSLITFAESGRVLLGDLNNDNRPDLFVVRTSGSGSFQCVYQGVPAAPGALGVFTAAAATPPLSGGVGVLGTITPILVDANGDGKLDVVFSGLSAFMNVYFQLGTINGAIQFTGVQTIDPFPGSVQAGNQTAFNFVDINRDGRRDLIRNLQFLDGIGWVVRVKFGVPGSNPAGGNIFLSMITLPVDPSPAIFSLNGAVTPGAVGDFFGDGAPDLLVDAPVPGTPPPPPAALFAITQPGDVAIDTPPAAQRVRVGQDATFHVVAHALDGVTPLGYQWLRDGVALNENGGGGRITGVTSATLNIAGAESNDTGVYSVNVTTGCVTRSASTFLDCSGTCGDVDLDGDVDLIDLAILLSNFGGFCP